MALQMTTGALMTCSFGVAPSALQILPTARVMAGGMPAATIADHVPLVNILPFGVCSCPQNPVVAAATIAALGVLTPMPCVPATSAPWVPGAPASLIGGLPALHDGCKLMCQWGGMIEFKVPAQFTVQV